MFVHCSYEKLSRLYIVVMRSYHVATMYSENATMYSQNATMYSQNATMYSATMYNKVLKSNLLEMKIIHRTKNNHLTFFENSKKITKERKKIEER